MVECIEALTTVNNKLMLIEIWPLGGLFDESLFSTDFTLRVFLREVCVIFCVEKFLSQGTDVTGFGVERAAIVQNSGKTSLHSVKRYLHTPGKSNFFFIPVSS